MPGGAKTEAVNWAALETPLNEPWLFPVEAPDGKRDQTELMRVVTFRWAMRLLAPQVLLYANANAGKRSRRQAAAEGIMAGVFDYCAVWTPSSHFLRPGVVWIEFKGYDKRGRAGQLSQAQIDFGNTLVRLGHQCAAFFDPMAAVDWVRSCGAPVREART